MSTAFALITRSLHSTRLATLSRTFHLQELIQGEFRRREASGKEWSRSCFREDWGLPLSDFVSFIGGF